MADDASAAAVTAVEAGCRIACFAVPRASRSAVTDWYDNRLKVALAAPPVDGEANRALVELLADVLEVPRRNVKIVSGETGRRKTVEVSGLDPAAAMVRIAEKMKKKR